MVIIYDSFTANAATMKTLGKIGQNRQLGYATHCGNFDRNLKKVFSSPHIIFMNKSGMTVT